LLLVAVAVLLLLLLSSSFPAREAHRFSVYSMYSWLL